MITMDGLIAASREYVCERWGVGEAVVELYAPVTRLNGRVWIHPTWAKEMRQEEAKRCASRIWRVSGSLWNPASFKLVHSTTVARV